MLASLRGLFTPQAVVQHLKQLPDVRSSIMDMLFPNRVRHPFPVLGIEQIIDTIGTVPLVSRGGISINTDSGSAQFDFVEPLPLKPSKEIAGQDLLNLKMLLGDRAGRDAYTREKIDLLRRKCRATTEAISSTMLTGKISWPVKLDSGGFENWEFDFGAPLSVVPTKKIDAADAKMADLEDLLDEMETTIQDAGIGGDIEFVAGRKAFNAISALAENFKTTIKHQVRRVKGGYEVNGFVVYKMSERYSDPRNGAMLPKISEHKILAFAKDAPGTVYYCALDDLDAKFQALPFYPKVVELPEGNGYKIVGQSKPMPVRSPKTLCWAEAVAE